MRVAIQIARTLPSVADLDDATVARLIDGEWDAAGWHRPSRGEMAVLGFAYWAERLLADVDAETVDQVLEVVDRLQAGMLR